MLTLPLEQLPSEALLITKTEADFVKHELCTKMFRERSPQAAIEFTYPLLLADVRASGGENLDYEDSSQPAEARLFHVGVLRCFLIDIAGCFTHVPATMHAVLKYYFGRMVSSSTASRLLPINPELLTDTAIDILRNVVCYRCSSLLHYLREYDEKSADQYRLLRAGILTVRDSDKTLIFATDIHFRHYFSLAYATKVASPPESTPDGVDNWLLTVLGSFERSVLQDRQGWSVVSNLPKEGVFQQMFHRGASMALPPTSLITGEMSRRYRGNNVCIAEIKKSKTGATGNLVQLMCVLSDES